MKSVLVLAAAALAAAQATTSKAPCAVVSSSLASTPSASIPAVVAYNCLNSVPVDTQGNSKLIDQLKQLWQFHSETVWLKNPGSDWENGPLDMMGELDRVKSNLQAGKYESEYQVHLAIQNITVRTGNYHLTYRPDILRVFTFRRQFGVASISSNGTALPKLYVHTEVAGLAEGDKTVSDIKSLNGMNPYDFLKSTFFSRYIDSDGRMNAMFNRGDTSIMGRFRSLDKYDGPTTDVVWSNSSEKSFTNVATTGRSFRGVVDGKSFSRAFCSEALTAQNLAISKSREEDDTIPDLPGPVPTIPKGTYRLSSHAKRSIPFGGTYPIAAVGTVGSTVAGYFLEDAGFNDVAVLKIISFSEPDDWDGESSFSDDFQATIKSFLQQCIGQNKKKLIIDLRENGGGSVNLYLDAFMQLFPDMDPFSAQRYRASDVFNKIGDAVDEVYTDPELASQADVGSRFRYWAWWRYRTTKGDNYDSWDQFNGPIKVNNDKYTTTFRYNYSSENRGFNFVNGSRPTAFQPSDVVMFTDALCGSACAAFHEELKNIAGVKAVTVGGRPQTGPIQTATGTKGGVVIQLSRFAELARSALDLASSFTLSSLESGDAALAAVANDSSVDARASGKYARAQFEDQIRKGDRTGTPLQFVYEAADCRVFYTADSWADPVEAWKQAWAAHSDSSRCVEGSTGHKSSISGGYKPYGPGPLASEDEPSSSSGSDSSGSSDSGGSSAPDENAASPVRQASLGMALGAVMFAIATHMMS